jgi:predicted small secreted protein
MRKFALMVIVLCVSALVLSACGGKTADPASKAVEDYLNALTAKDSTKLSALSCKDWESDALMELDSLQAVKTRLEGLSCKSSGTTGTTTQVNCQGKLVATYNGEDQTLDIASRTYKVEQNGGEYLVCGYK